MMGVVSRKKTKFRVRISGSGPSSVVNPLCDLGKVIDPLFFSSRVPPNTGWTGPLLRNALEA